jgi:beta-fructofuranosidase
MTLPLNKSGTVPDWQARAREQRAALAADPHRPTYHFLPPANWMNDPNGFIQWGEEYHLFYQHNPNGPFWGTIHWGHAVSKDLVHWRDLPIALLPTSGAPDDTGCFSGCTVDDHGVPTLLYTGVFGDQQTQCLATSRDGLVTWRPDAGNPVLAGAPPGMRPEDFRDPFVWREGDVWYMVLGTGVQSGGGAALLYRSQDLRRWEYLHPLLEGKLEETGEVWECPNFFPLGDKHVLIVSVWPRAYVYYFIGSYQNHRFVPEYEGKLDHNGSFYAPLSTLDQHGRRLLVGWLDEWRSAEAQREAGWAGTLSLPQELLLHPSGQLGVRPIPELEVLRSQHVEHQKIRVSKGEVKLVEGVRGEVLELNVQFGSQGAQRYGVVVRRSPDGQEETQILYDVAGGQLVIDRSRHSSAEEVNREPHVAALKLAADEPLELRIFIDHSVLEVFANGRAFIASRIYPIRPDSQQVALIANGELEVPRLDAWTLQPTWPLPDLKPEPIKENDEPV